MNATPSPRQRGAAALAMVVALVLLATLASAWGSRAVLMDLLAQQGLARAAQARLAAQAALADAEAQLLTAQALNPNSGLMAQSPLSCPADLKDKQWQCTGLTIATSAMDPQWQTNVLLARDLIDSPHVWQLRVSATSRSQAGQASVRQSIFMPVLTPAPADASGAALILNGCASEAVGSSWQICPLSNGSLSCTGTASGPAVYSHFVPDTDQDGRIGHSERSTCMAFAPSTLSAGGGLESPSVPTRRLPCNRAAWQSVFGNITPAQLQTWSDAQSRQGLSALSQPARSIYWIDSPADWTQSLGTPSAPVLLVFSSQACAQRCPRLAAGVRIHGTVYADAGCDDEKMRGWQAAWVEGQVVIEAGLPQVTGQSRLVATPTARQAYLLDWPRGIDPNRVQRAPGSRWEGTP